MTATPLGAYARTPQDVALWAELSLQESQMRRRTRRPRWSVALMVAVVAAVWVLMVFYATGAAA